MPAEHTFTVPSVLCELHNMYTLCIFFVTCCAFYPRAFAAPMTLNADSRSQLEGNAEQNDRLQEEIDGQESILSKVGGHAHLLHTFT